MTRQKDARAARRRVGRFLAVWGDVPRDVSGTHHEVTGQWTPLRVADVRAVLAEAARCEPPGFVTTHQMKFAGDILNRHAAAMQAAGARHADHYAMNQLAHWLWRMSAALSPRQPKRGGKR